MNKEMYILQGSRSQFENIINNNNIKADGKLYRKEIIRVGEWVHPQNQKHKFQVTLDRMKEWITNFNKNLFKAFVPERHSEDPSDNRGWLRGLQIEGEKLFGIFDITNKDAQIMIDNKTIKDVSVAADDYIDNQGNKHGNVIKHVCLTVIPYIDNQEGFMALENGNKVNLIYLEKTQKEGINMDELARMNVELEKAKIGLEKVISEKAESEKVNALNATKIIELEKVNAEAIKVKDVEIAELKKSVAEFETMKAKAREEAIDAKLELLVKPDEKGISKITPAIRDKFRVLLLQDSTLKLEKGEVKISDFILEALGEMTGIKLGADSKTKDEKPADGVMTPEKAKFEAERIIKEGNLIDQKK